MDYSDLKNVAKTRIYRSIFPFLPIEQWKLVYEGKGADFKANLSLKDEPRVPHYFRAQYVFKDGQLSGLSEPECVSFDDKGRGITPSGKNDPHSNHFKIEYRKRD